MFEKMVRVLREEDPPNPGPGGDPAPKDGDDALVKMTPAQLEERLRRASDAAIKKYDADLLSKGQRLTEDEAKALAEDRAARQKDEEKKRSQHGNEAATLALAAKDKLIEEERLKNTDLAKRFDNALVASEVTQAISGLTLSAGANARALQSLITGSGAIRVEDGAVGVFDDKGVQRYSMENNGEFMSVAEYVRLVTEKEHAIYLAPAGKAGTGNTTNRTNGRAVTLPPNHESREVWDTLTPEQKVLAKANSGLGPTDKPTGNPYHKVPAK